MRSRWLGIGGVVAAVASVLVGAWAWRANSPFENPEHAYAYRSQGVVVAGVAGLPVESGQTVSFDTYLVNDSGHPLLVRAARVATVPGQRKPQLTHVALVHGHNVVGVQNWPPVGVALSPLVGNYLPPGRSDIAVGVTGQTPGMYVAAGVTLTLSDGHDTYRATAWGGGLACVVPDLTVKAPRRGCAFGPAERKVRDFIHKQ